MSWSVSKLVIALVTVYAIYWYYVTKRFHKEHNNTYYEFVIATATCNECFIKDSLVPSFIHSIYSSKVAHLPLRKNRPPAISRGRHSRTEVDRERQTGTRNVFAGWQPSHTWTQLCCPRKPSTTCQPATRAAQRGSDVSLRSPCPSPCSSVENIGR